MTADKVGGDTLVRVAVLPPGAPRAVTSRYRPEFLERVTLLSLLAENEGVEVRRRDGTLVTYELLPPVGSDDGGGRAAYYRAKRGRA